MTRAKHLGYLIEIKLSEECGYEGYSAWCAYKYNKSAEKYSLSMWLKRHDIDDTFKIESQEIDTQIISGTRETIEENICRIVEQAALSGFFDYYIERYEYTYNCYDLGEEVLDQRRVSND